MDRDKPNGRPIPRTAAQHQDPNHEVHEHGSAALRWAARGWEVFPLRPGTKGGRGNYPTGTWKDATTDPDTIRAWWDKWPDANIGVATGARSGLVVIDVDGPTGAESLAKLEADPNRGALPVTFTVATPRPGGRHIYVAHPGGQVQNRQGGDWRPWGEDQEPATGLDVRGDGGYAVLPPSVRPDGAYTVESGNADELGELSPAWCDVLVTGPGPNDGAGALQAPAEDPFSDPDGVWTVAEVDQHITPYLDRLRAATEGHRNGTLNKTGVRVGHFIPGRWSWDEAVGMLRPIAEEIGLEPEEIAATLSSSLRAGMADPYTVVEDQELAVPEPDRFEAEVARQLLRMEATEEARRRIAAKTAATLPDPHGTPLADLLAEPDDDPVYRVEGLWPTGGNVIFSAQRKAGKTTARDNLVRCLVDGDDFLGDPDPFTNPDIPRFKVTPVEDGEAVYVADLELDRRTLRRWLRDQNIGQRGRVLAESFRGRVDEFDVLDEARREKWAAFFRERGVQVLIVDPLGAILDMHGLDENSNSDVGPVLQALDALKAAAGIRDLLVVHHMGHTGERSRGASKLRGWPDAEWMLLREQGEGNTEPPPDAARFFMAEGRDVSVPETKLAYSLAGRRLSIAGGNRTQHKATKYGPPVLEIIKRSPGLNLRGIQDAASGDGIPRDPARGAARALIRAGKVHTAPGPRGAVRHYPADKCQTPKNCEAAQSETDAEQAA
jgi:hypothetical protein